jgi:hypothetical protein
MVLDSCTADSSLRKRNTDIARVAFCDQVSKLTGKLRAPSRGRRFQRFDAR